jgi:hypothetical protein
MACYLSMSGKRTGQYSLLRTSNLFRFCWFFCESQTYSGLALLPWLINMIYIMLHYAFVVSKLKEANEQVGI